MWQHHGNPVKRKQNVTALQKGEKSNEIEKIYLYYLHNISLMNWRENMIHIRKNSSEGLKLVQDLKLSWDFIYIDGSHYYEGIKHDFLKLRLLRTKKILCWLILLNLLNIYLLIYSRFLIISYKI